MKKILLLALGLVMAACAPSSYAPGKSGFTPFEAKVGSVTLPGAGVWFVKTQASVKIPLSTRDNSLEGAYGYDDVNVGYKNSTSVTWVSLGKVKTEPGWEVRLDRQEGSREVTGVRYEGTTKWYTYRDGLSVVLSVTVPNGTKPGTYPVIAELKSLTSADTGSAEFDAVVTAGQ